MVIRVVSGIAQKVVGEIFGGCVWKGRSYGFGLADFLGLGLNGSVVQSVSYTHLTLPTILRV